MKRTQALSIFNFKVTSYANMQLRHKLDETIHMHEEQEQEQTADCLKNLFF